MQPLLVLDLLLNSNSKCYKITNYFINGHILSKLAFSDGSTYEIKDNYGASYSQSKWVGFTDTGYRLNVPIIYENSTSTCAITVEHLPDSSELYFVH